MSEMESLAFHRSIRILVVDTIKKEKRKKCGGSRKIAALGWIMHLEELGGYNVFALHLLYIPGVGVQKIGFRDDAIR
jgi:hypothetical protein